MKKLLIMLAACTAITAWADEKTETALRQENAPTPAEAGSAAAAQQDSVLECSSWWTDKLFIGARVYHFELSDTRRSQNNKYSNNNIAGNFIGSVWGLDEEQDYFPRLYVEWAFSPYLHLGLTYDHVRAATVDWANDEKSATSTDGDVEVWGPLLYAAGRLPNDTIFTPFLELGWAEYFASFDVNPAWAAVGPGYRFEVDDTSGYFFGLGVDVEFADNWSVNLYWRQMSGADVRARAYFTPTSRIGRKGSFPMDYDIVALGIQHGF